MPFSEGKSMGKGHSTYSACFPWHCTMCGREGHLWCSLSACASQQTEGQALAGVSVLNSCSPKGHKHPVLKSSVQSKRQAGSRQGTSTPKNTRYWMKYLGKWSEFSLLRTWFTRERHLDLLACSQGFVNSLDNPEGELSLRQKSSLLPSKNLLLHEAHYSHP